MSAKASSASKEKSIEQLFAELDGYLATIDEMRLPAIYAELRSVRRLCLGCLRLAEDLQDKLGIVEKAKAA